MNWEIILSFVLGVIWKGALDELVDRWFLKRAQKLTKRGKTTIIESGGKK
jgi:hypothetical protein